MMQSGMAILWPTMALVLLVFVVWFTLLLRRFAHVARHPPSAVDFDHAEAAARYFRPVERPAHNLANLFEMPVLYFALVPLLMLTGQATLVQVTLAWAFAGLRAWHSYLHIGSNPIRWRARVYIASCTVLAAMWLGLAIDLARAGGRA